METNRPQPYADGCKDAFIRGLSTVLKGVDGDVAEVGVYRGGSAYTLCRVFPEKTVHLFDTFEGMPDQIHDTDNGHSSGDFSDTSLEEVQEALSEFDNAVFYKGVFPETSGPIKDKKFALVHVDCDIYQSVMDCCEFFYPKMAEGGVLLFDDYRANSCEGAKVAVDKFCAANKTKTSSFKVTLSKICIRKP